jgi:hypothetical protein
MDALARYLQLSLIPVSYQFSFTNYIQVTDDSDIEGRDIHENRMARNFKIAQLKVDIDCNSVLLGRVIEIEKEVREKGPC